MVKSRRILVALPGGMIQGTLMVIIKLMNQILTRTAAVMMVIILAMIRLLNLPRNLLFLTGPQSRERLQNQNLQNRRQSQGHRTKQMFHRGQNYRIRKKAAVLNLIAGLYL